MHYQVPEPQLPVCCVEASTFLQKTQTIFEMGAYSVKKSKIKKIAFFVIRCYVLGEMIWG